MNPSPGFVAATPRSRSDGVPDLLRYARRVLDIRAGQKDEELLPTYAIDQVVSTHCLTHLIGDIPQHYVAGCMAIAVVDALEVIQIAYEDADRLPGHGSLLLQLGSPSPTRRRYASCTSAVA